MFSVGDKVQVKDEPLLTTFVRGKTGTVVEVGENSAGTIYWVRLNDNHLRRYFYTEELDLITDDHRVELAFRETKFYSETVTFEEAETTVRLLGYYETVGGPRAVAIQRRTGVDEWKDV